MSKETGSMVGQRYSFLARVRGRDHIGMEDQYMRLDPYEQHGTGLTDFLAPVIHARRVPTGGWRSGKTQREHRNGTHRNRFLNRKMDPNRAGASA